MKYARSAFILLFAAVLFFCCSPSVLTNGIFKFFRSGYYSESALQRIKNYNPEENTLYLPGLENKELFESIQDMSICRNDAVRGYIYLYLTSGREYLVNSITRSCLYIDIINDIMKNNPDIPSEIAILPLLESGFDPNAVSRSNAVGLWQFLQSTSSRLDLKSNKWIDERRNIEKSTEAAIRHLRYLHKILNSWDLALAAYNGGDGQIRRAIDKTGSHNIWELIKSGTLTKETSEYVPRYAALVIIYNNQRLFGIEDEVKIPSREKTETVKLNYPMNISQVSKICGIEIDEIKKYNPELNSSMTPPGMPNYPLRLTASSAKKFNINLGGLYISMISYPENYILTQLPSELLF